MKFTGARAHENETFKYYAYKGIMKLGDEPLGTDGKMMFELKTDIGAIRRVKRFWGCCGWTLTRYLNFYDPRTFYIVARCIH